MEEEWRETTGRLPRSATFCVAAVLVGSKAGVVGHFLFFCLSLCLSFFSLNFMNLVSFTHYVYLGLKYPPYRKDCFSFEK